MTSIVRELSKTDAEIAEWQLRCDMAAVFRVGARLDWNEQIGNHNSVMLPGEIPLFRINPRGLLFQELTPSSLIVCDLDGNVVRGKGELREVAFHIHARIHLRNPRATCVVHVHPPYLTALSVLADAELELVHHNNLMLNDRIVYDRSGYQPVADNEEGDRIADLLGDRTIMVMAHHGVTTVGATVHEAFDECFIAERNARIQMIAWQTGRKMAVLPDQARRRCNGPWGSASTRACISMPGAACSTGRSRITQPDPGLARRRRAPRFSVPPPPNGAAREAPAIPGRRRRRRRCVGIP